MFLEKKKKLYLGTEFWKTICVLKKKNMFDWVNKKVFKNK